MNPKFKRIILKFSGESFSSGNGDIIDGERLNEFANVVKAIHDDGVAVGIVIGAGNIYRGRTYEKLKIEQSDADYMGMLGTNINCLALYSKLKSIGVPCIYASAVAFKQVGEEYDIERSNKYLEEGKVVLFAGGTGKPFCSTDTAAAQRAVENNIDAILMGKSGVDGIYDKDPNKNKDARFIKELKYQEIIDQNLGVIDVGAAKILNNTNVVVKIFAASDVKNYVKVANGEDIGSIIRG